jgi:OOP family OmpA-OmpF porin
MRNRVGHVLIALLIGYAAHAIAQPAPTVDQLLKQLTPNGASGTRGIRPSPGAASPAPQSSTAAPPAAASAGGSPTAAAPSPAAPPPHAMASAVEKPSVDLNVQFATGSADLTPNAENLLNVLGQALTSPQLANAHFRVEGHTDTTGSRTLNQTLSTRRAEAVVDYLSQKFGVKSDRLQAVGKGQDDLLVPTPDQTPEPRNRRVHVVNLDG